jgi:hypothetical protein
LFLGSTPICIYFSIKTHKQCIVGQFYTPALLCFLLKKNLGPIHRSLESILRFFYLQLQRQRCSMKPTAFFKVE